jgi:hypothetical protein
MSVHPRALVALALWASLAVPAFAVPVPPSPHFGGPCLAADTTLELIAKGTCRCANGACVELKCTGEVGVGANVEVLKGTLKATLEAKAKAMDGQLVGEVTFELHAKP